MEEGNASWKKRRANAAFEGGIEAKVATVSLSCEILEDAEALHLPTRESQLSAALFSRAI